MRRLSPLLLTCCALLSGCATLLPTLRLSAQSRRSRVLRVDGSGLRRDWYGQALLSARWSLGALPPRPPRRIATAGALQPALAGRLPCVAFCAWERDAIRGIR